MELSQHLKTRMAQRKLAHAYLVVGENRRQLADQLAAAWVCTGEAPPCGHCAGCRKAAQGIHPDIVRADPEGEGLKAEAVRAFGRTPTSCPTRRQGRSTSWSTRNC